MKLTRNINHFKSFPINNEPPFYYYCHLRWPTTVTAKQSHGTTNFTHGKTKFTHGKTKFTHGKTKFTHGKTKKTSWSAVVIYIRDGTSCNSNTLLARKTAIFRAHDVLLRVWFGSLLSLRCAIPSCIPHMIQVHE